MIAKIQICVIRCWRLVPPLVVLEENTIIEYRYIILSLDPTLHSSAVGKPSKLPDETRGTWDWSMLRVRLWESFKLPRNTLSSRSTELFGEMESKGEKITLYC